MVDLQTIADRVQIEALRGEFTDAAMMNDHDRLASLFTADGAIRIPDAGIEVVGPDQIRALGVQREERAACFVQNTHPGVIELDGDTASGRTYLSELFQLRNGNSHVNYGVYRDRYRRTPAGWKFVERAYEMRYVEGTEPVRPRAQDGHGTSAPGRKRDRE